jgi:inorganic triphosphatase YgiF
MAIEVEAKLELQRDAYIELLQIGSIKQEIEQLNVYYDSEWILAGHGATFRVRFARGALPVCTLKIPISVDNSGLRVSREIEEPLQAATTRPAASIAPARSFPVQSLSARYRDALGSVNVDRLRRVGWVRNRRTVIEIRGLGEVEVDQLRLPNGITFFEAEIEHADRAVIGALSQFLRQRWPSVRPSSMGKFERFRRAAAEMQERSQLVNSRLS